MTVFKNATSQLELHLEVDLVCNLSNLLLLDRVVRRFQCQNRPDGLDD